MLAVMICFFCLPGSGLTAAHWVEFQGSPEHTGVFDVETPIKAEDAALYWAVKIQSDLGWNAAPSHPMIVDDVIVFFAKKTIYKMDMNSGEILQQGSLEGASNWNITMPTYGEGTVFVALSDGRIQALDFETLESKWLYQNERKGQSNCPISYFDGRVYTGYWRTPDRDADFVCVDAKTGEEVWTLTHKGGFYWAGCYVTDDYLLVGSDDGQGTMTGEDENQTPTAVLYSLNPRTGDVIDRVDNINGDIRSTVSYADGKAYFVSKGNLFYEVPVDASGHFDKEHIAQIALRNSSTSTPTIYNGRAYIGVVGDGGQFVKYGGHHIDVIDLETKSVAYECPTMGYVQTSGVLTTAYEEKDGYVYVYFVDNYTPGKIRVIKDKPGQTSMLAAGPYADILFTPVGEQEEYALCSPIPDEYGTFYLKNDSGFIMALGWNIEKIEVTKAPDKTTYVQGETFDPAGMEVTATLVNGKTKDVTNYVEYDDEPLSLEDIDVTLSYSKRMYHDVDDGDDTNDENLYNQILPPLYATVEIRVKKAATDQDVADGVIRLINAIGTVTADSGDAIAAAREGYDKLTAAQKALVTNYAALTAAETAYDAVVQRIDAVKALIGAIGEVTADSGDAIAAAREGYDALSAAEQKYVDNYAVLTAAETEYEALMAADRAAAQAVVDLIAAIGEVTEDSGDAIASARAGFDALTAPQRKLVTNADVLLRAEALYAELTGGSEALVASVEAAIAAIGEVTLDSGDAIAAAEAAYEALTEKQKDQVDNYDVLTAAREAYDKLAAQAAADRTAADAVKALIADIGEVTLDREEAITAARTAYDALTAAQKELVDNTETLTAAETKLAQLKKDESDRKAAEEVKALIAAIGEVTKDSGDAIAAARTAFDALSDEQKALVDNASALTAAETKYAELTKKPENPFTDIRTGAYYYEPVLWAVENDITKGTSATLFSPNAYCTRGMVVTFLWRAAGEPEPSSTRNPFRDVRTDAYYYKAMLWAVEKGITRGTSSTTFSPNDDCTRGMVVTFQWRAAGQPGSSSAHPFYDVKSGAYYEKAVLWAVEKDITKGTSDTTFSPNDRCTRGMVVTFLFRAK